MNWFVLFEIILWVLDLWLCIGSFVLRVCDCTLIHIFFFVQVASTCCTGEGPVCFDFMSFLNVYVYCGAFRRIGCKCGCRDGSNVRVLTFLLFPALSLRYVSYISLPFFPSGYRV